MKFFPIIRKLNLQWLLNLLIVNIKEQQINVMNISDAVAIVESRCIDGFFFGSQHLESSSIWKLKILTCNSQDFRRVLKIKPEWNVKSANTKQYLLSIKRIQSTRDTSPPHFSTALSSPCSSNPIFISSATPPFPPYYILLYGSHVPCLLYPSCL